MNIDQFKSDLVEAMKAKDTGQAELADLTGISQPTLSLFLSGARKGLSGGAVLALWPFVYGDKRPPAKDTPPEVEA